MTNIGNNNEPKSIGILIKADSKSKVYTSQSNANFPRAYSTYLV